MEHCPHTREIEGGGTGTATLFSPAYSNSGELLTGLTAVSSEVSRTTSSPPSVRAGVWYEPPEAGEAILSGIDLSSDSSRTAATKQVQQWHNRSLMDSTRAPSNGKASSNVLT
jgi:hypothetical protein